MRCNRTHGKKLSAPPKHTREKCKVYKQTANHRSTIIVTVRCKLVTMWRYFSFCDNLINYFNYESGIPERCRHVTTINLIHIPFRPSGGIVARRTGCRLSIFFKFKKLQENLHIDGLRLFFNRSVISWVWLAKCANQWSVAIVKSFSMNLIFLGDFRARNKDNIMIFLINDKMLYKVSKSNFNETDDSIIKNSATTNCQPQSANFN